MTYSTRSLWSNLKKSKTMITICYNHSSNKHGEPTAKLQMNRSRGWSHRPVQTPSVGISDRNNGKSGGPTSISQQIPPTISLARTCTKFSVIRERVWEKQPVEAQNCKKRTDPFFKIYGIYPQVSKKTRKITTHYRLVITGWPWKTLRLIFSTN